MMATGPKCDRRSRSTLDAKYPFGGVNGHHRKSPWAATSPWGRARMNSRPLTRTRSCLPASPARSASISSGGRWDRFASVSLRTLLPDLHRAAQQMGLVGALCAIGGHVVATRRRYVHRFATSWHGPSLHRGNSPINSLVATIRTQSQALSGSRGGIAAIRDVSPV